MAKEKSVATFADELVDKRLDVLKKYFADHPDEIKKWEELKLDFETAKFKRDYIKKNELFNGDPQLSLFGK